MPILSEDYVNNTATVWPAIQVGSNETQLPAAPDTKPGCLKFQNYKTIATLQDSFYAPIEQRTDNIANKCTYIATNRNISLALFLTWNPSLRLSTYCTLKPGYSYCVNHPDKNVVSTSLSATQTTTVTSTSMLSSTTRSSTATTTTRSGSVTSTSKPASSNSSTKTSSPPSSQPASTSSCIKTTTAVTTTVRTSSTTRVTSATASSSPVCVVGTGVGNYEGLCKYTCG